MARAKKFIKVDGDPIRLSNDKLLELFGNREFNIIIRSLLVTELRRCEREDVPIRTLRNVWYKQIKPILSRIGYLDPARYPLDAEGRPKIPDFPRKLSAIMASMVKEGICSYHDMSIIDGSRQRRPGKEVIAPLYNVSLVGVHRPEIILFTEKDTVWPIVQNLASIYGISAISGGGQPSLSCTEDMVRKISDSIDENNLDPDLLENICLLTLTDYDPAGYIISNAQYTQLCTILYEHMGIENLPTLQRVGLFPDQLSAEDRAANAYQPAWRGLEEWFMETGGVDGEPLGLELDALSLREFRSLFISGIQNEIDNEEAYHDELRKSFIEKLAWEAAEDEVQKLLDVYRDKLGGVELICDDDTIETFALSGFGSIDPVDYDDHVFNAINEAKDLLNE